MQFSVEVKIILIHFEDTISLLLNTPLFKHNAEQALNSFIADYSAATPLARKYADGVSASFLSFGIDVPGSTFVALASMLTNLELTKNPFTQTKPTVTLKKPNASGYAGGSTDPEYLSALSAYLIQAEAAQKYSCDLYNYEAEINLKSIRRIAELAPEFEQTTQTMLSLKNSYAVFIEDSDITECKAAMQQFELLDSYYRSCITKSSIKAYSYYWLKDSKDGFMYSNLQFSQLYK